MHIHVTDALIGYPHVKFVWAHVGLSMEFATPALAVHVRTSELLATHTTFLDLGFRTCAPAKLNFMNYDGLPIEDVLGAQR